MDSTKYQLEASSKILPDQGNMELKSYCGELAKQITLNNKILLVKGPQMNLEAFERSVAVNRCYYAYPPTGLQYLSSALRGRNLEIDILDGNFEFLKRAIKDKTFDASKWFSIVEEYFKDNNPSIVGISNLYDIDAPTSLQIAKYLRDARSGKQIVLMGGQKATYSPQGLLNQNLCHFALQREAENKIQFIVDMLSNQDGQQIGEMKGVLFKHNGKIFETSGESDVVVSKGTLIKQYDKIKIEEYCQVGTLSPFSRMAGKDKPFATVIFNRGCHGGCEFCDVTDLTGRYVRSRPTQDLLEEIAYLYKERGIRHIEFLDDDLARYKGKLLNALGGIKDLNLTELSWASSNGIIASCLDEDLLRKFVETGCNGFRIGVESGNPEILKRVGKPGTIKKFREFSKIAQKFPSLFIGDNYIVGFPQVLGKEKRLPAENFGQMMDSFRFSQEMDLDWASFAIYQANSSSQKAGEKEWADVYQDFIPTKEVIGCRLETEGVRKGLEVFTIPKEQVPSREQLKEIWVTFNFAKNYMLNKNLSEGGSPRKFIKWTEAIQERYPDNPEMSLFLGIAHLLDGNKPESERQNILTEKNLKDPYWNSRFNQFGLEDIIKNLPANISQAEQAMKFMGRKLNDYNSR